jgi:hypothetical protein
MNQVAGTPNDIKKPGGRRDMKGLLPNSVCPSEKIKEVVWFVALKKKMYLDARAPAHDQ